MLTGEDLRRTSAEALPQLVAGIDVFAEIEPLQKEQILRALRESGAVVGFLGDGINDASALHAADVGISVDGAVDVAKVAADIVLLRHDLSVLARGVRLGRETFANTLKYIFITTSANFGNMLSMAGASLFLPFTPLARPSGWSRCRCASCSCCSASPPPTCSRARPRNTPSTGTQPGASAGRETARPPADGARALLARAPP